jgi:hypothetical protein
VVLAFCAAMLLLQREPSDPRLTTRGPRAVVPEAAFPSETGERYLNIPAHYLASLYRSPIDGPLILEWPGGTRVIALGWRFFDGFADWELIRDPSGNEGWVAALFLDERLTAFDPPTDESYPASVWWEKPIQYCVNPVGGPPGLDGEAFVALVERAADRWQEVADGHLPLESQGRCESSPDARGDGVNTVGWTDDLGLVIAAQAWPDADQGVVNEIDIRVSRGYFQRLRARDPTKTLQTCVFSTLVHELGHLIGLDHPGSRSLASSMQGFGASRCDKGQPTASDRANLLQRYAPGQGAP